MKTPYYSATIQAHFSAAHKLRDYETGCARLHGHNWKVQVTLASTTLDSMGMVMDFKHIKSILKTHLEPWDHQLLNDIPPFNDINPTAENIAVILFQTLTINLKEIFKNKSSAQHDSPDRVWLEKVTVYETDGYSASYTGRDVPA